nr:GRIP and coiled coil domain containing protein [Hymenolepis microstoma]
MSMISADECYSNVDSLEELRRICGERDALVNKLKLLLVRKNKTISSLEEEIGLLKSGKSSESMNTESKVNLELDSLKSTITRQQAELDLSKKELATLSKMNNDLQKCLSTVKQERDTFKSEVGRIMNDLVTVNARTTELYGVASKLSQLSPKVTHSSPNSQHAFVLSTLKGFLANGHNKPTPALLDALQDVNNEINQLLGTKNHSPSIKTFDEVQKLLEYFSTSLKEYRPPKTAFDVDKCSLMAKFNDISKDRDELRSSLNSFSQQIHSSLQHLVSSIQNLQDLSPNYVNNATLLKFLSKFKDDLGDMKEVILQNNSIITEDSSNFINRIGSILPQVQKSPYKIILDDSVLTDLRLHSTLSVLPHLQKDVLDVKSSARQYFASLQAQIDDIQRLHTKLMLELNTQSPPPYPETIETPNSTALEALLTDVWQLKDCLSGMKDLVLEQSSRYHRTVEEINSHNGKLFQNLQSEIVKIRAATFTIRKEATQISEEFNQQFSGLLNLLQNLNVPPVKSPVDLHEQRFKDYDRLVRDKEAEIDQLRETCDRFSDECDRFGTLREALRLLVIQKMPSVNFAGLNSEDAGLLNDLVVRLNHNQATRLELAEQTQAIFNLQIELEAKCSALDAAVSRATDAETSAAEAQAEVASLQEKLACAKQLLMRARKDASESEKKADKMNEMEKELEGVKEELEAAKRNFFQTDQERMALERELVEVKEEKERIEGRISVLRKQFESYKVKALYALRNGDSKVEENLHPSSGGIVADSPPLSWRYECSSLAQSEAARLKETIKVLEASLAQTTSRLNSVTVELETANFALVEEKEKCSRLSQSLQTERNQWLEERETLITKWQNETTNRVAELEATLVQERSKQAQILSEQAEEFKTAYCAKIVDLQLQLESAEAKVEAQRMKLLEQSKVIATSIQSPPNNSLLEAPSQDQRHLCARCGRSLSNASNPAIVGLNNSDSPRMHHRTRTLEEALLGAFDDEEAESPAIQEAKKEISDLKETISNLKSQLTNERHNLEYTKSLLADSEATVERLSAQANILKSEIRRHERNADRERDLGTDSLPPSSPTNAQSASEGVTRTEYLKNVLLSFLCGASTGGINASSSASGIGSSLERLALVPVLATLLALAPNERDALQKVAQTGMLLHSDDASSEVNLDAGGGWGGYIGLPSWLGGG